MIATSGHSVIVLALILSAAGALACFAGSRWSRFAAWGTRAAHTVALLVILAVGIMELALIRHDFSVKYVADVGSRETPLYYTIISLWGALEGSILFWALLLSVYTLVFLRLSRRRTDSIRRLTTGVLLCISSFFLFVIAGPGNPFVLLNPVPSDGQGPNPLLQNHWMMGVHPQLLYAGYVGLSVPYAIAIASLLTGTPGLDVMRLIRRWALVPWIFLSLGIVAGMWWSYAVLGWGGYWSWDPVENASVMPWLIATAFLHSLQVQERRQMLKSWTLSLVIAAFLFSILGTFLTRSGVLASVHSFTQTSIGPLFLTFFAIVLVSSLGLLLVRGPELSARGALESTLCRETAFLFNNLLLVAMTFTILLGTVFPLLAEALQGSQLSVGAPYFNHVVVPMGFALLFLMGVGPVLPWGAARMEDVQYKLLRPVIAGVGTILLLLILGVRGVGSLVSFGTASFVMAVTLGRILADVRVRRGNTPDHWLTSARRLMAMNPRRYGGYLAHVGVLLIVIGIAASQTYQVRHAVTLRPGQRAMVDGYTVEYRGWHPNPQPNRMVIQARVDASRDGQFVGSVLPSQNIYLGLTTPVVTPGVLEQPWSMVLAISRGQNPIMILNPILHGHNPIEDVYVVLEAVTSQPNGPATLQILINPLVGFIWLGGMIVAFGGILALLPARRRKAYPVSVPEPVRLQPEEAAV
ncbi:MAG: heme lyase CcmF/NrfE family subunit [Chloroflexota bacterium]